jgi:hypothetical protein
MSVINIPEVEVEMRPASPNARTLRATVVQASTVFYDTPATVGMFSFAQHLIGQRFESYRDILLENNLIPNVIAQHK